MGIVYGNGRGLNAGGQIYTSLKAPIDVETLKRAAEERKNLHIFLSNKLGIQQDPVFAEKDAIMVADKDFRDSLSEFRRKNAVDLGEKPINYEKDNDQKK